MRLTDPLQLPAPGRHHTQYVVLRLTRALGFWETVATHVSLHPSPAPSARLVTSGARPLSRKYRAMTYASRTWLRDRLTRGRLALPRNPWAYGERVYHRFYRYSSLHKLFHPLQLSLPSTFAANGMLAYRSSLRKNPQLRHYTLAP